MDKKKPILCLDFDGVIHSYTTPWKGEDIIPDPPVKGAISALVDYSDFFELHIFSSRSKTKEGREAMYNWLYIQIQLWLNDKLGKLRNEQAVISWMTDNIKWPTEKPPAFLTIDDRGWTFEGVFPSVEEIQNFVPRNKRKDQEDASR